MSITAGHATTPSTRQDATVRQRVRVRLMRRRLDRDLAAGVEPTRSAPPTS